MWFIHGLYMRDTYTNSIIQTFFYAESASYPMTIAVKTVETLFTRCGHERYTMMMENIFFFIKSIIKSYTEGTKCSDTRTIITRN